MKKEKALEFIPKFPELTEKIHKQINNELPAWLIADKKRKIMRCTQCGEVSPDDPKAKQGDVIMCSACERSARYMKNHYEYVTPGFDGYIAVMLPAPHDETLYIRCFIARRYVQKGKPYYTIEVSNEYKIVQCRGYRNNTKNTKPKTVENFEKQYQEYLDSIVRKKARSNNDSIGNKNTAGGRKPRGNGRIHQSGEPSLQDNESRATRTAVAV